MGPRSCQGGVVHSSGRSKKMPARGWVFSLLAVAVLAMLPGGRAIKCFEGSVTYCGINADGGAIAPTGKRMYVQGMNWACLDQQSNMDPTFIAPNCWDQETCENLQTNDFDDDFNISHESPYNYVADKAWLQRRRGEKNVTDCPPDHPACGLQTTLRMGQDEACNNCYTRYRYSADIGAIYWDVWQIHKHCVKDGETCEPSECHCINEGPKYYEGNCSGWAKAACRRKAYKCKHFPADYVITTFQDYDIMFCSLGNDDPVCNGCVACQNSSCLQPVIHVSKLLDGSDLTNASNYNCSMEICGEGPRTCWNSTCWEGDDCWPVCDEKLYAESIPAASAGFYVSGSSKVLVERTKCCNSNDYCNYANSGSSLIPTALAVLFAAVLSFVHVF